MKGVSYPAALERAVRHRLAHRLHHEIMLNAAAGYVLDPELPPLEVFERPGWRHRTAEPGSYRYVFPVFDAEPNAYVVPDASPPAEEPRHREVEIRPKVTATVDVPPHRFRAGLGFDVDERMLVFFPSLS